MKWNSKGGTVKVEQSSGTVMVEQSRWSGTGKWKSNGRKIRVEQ